MCVCVCVCELPRADAVDLQNANYYTLGNTAKTKPRQENVARAFFDLQKRKNCLATGPPIFDHMHWRRIILDEGTWYCRCALPRRPSVSLCN